MFSNLRRHAAAVRALLPTGSPLGLALRLSPEEAAALLSGSQLQELSAWFRREGFYVPLLNAGACGSFRGGAAEDPFAPDWLDPRRLHYVLQLAAILGELLPEGGEGGISTIPLASKARTAAADPDARRTIGRNLARVAEALFDLHTRTGRLIHLDIEPGPGGLIETTEDAIRFFDECLLAEDAAGVARRHIRVCLDACHLAVNYEDPGEAIRALAAADVRVGRVQVSNALKVSFSDPAGERERVRTDLERLSVGMGACQVGERRVDGTVRRHTDLEHALASLDTPGAQEWRLHLHVPVFTSEFGAFGSTQDDLLRILAVACAPGGAEHLEIETYEWQVVPEDRQLDPVASIAREFLWTWTAICARQTPSSAE